MLLLAWKNLCRRPMRTLLTVSGLAVSAATLISLLALGEGYQSSLRRELDGMGMQMMLVPLGCPFDAAARVLKGRDLDASLPDTALNAARHDPAVAVAAPLYTAVLPRPELGRTDLWVGIDASMRPLKPWWKMVAGSRFPERPDDVLLGAEAAEAELRKPGDRFYSPETGRTFTVCGVLERTGTSDDSLFFVPLGTAQSMFHELGRLTAVAVRLKDPVLLSEASERLQRTPGAQVVTLAEMMGTFLNLVGGARSLVLAVVLVSVAVSALGVFNTMTSAVLERTRELSVLRAVGFSRGSTFFLMAFEALLLSLVGGAVGLMLAGLVGGVLVRAAVPFLPLASGGLPALTLEAALSGLTCILVAGMIAGLLPAWQASRLHPAEALRAK